VQVALAFTSKFDILMNLRKCFIGVEGLLDLVDRNPDSHFFLDEVKVSSKTISSKSLAEISLKIPKNNFLWIACQADQLLIKTDDNLKGKTVPH
jgi:hypothetical protein